MGLLKLKKSNVTPPDRFRFVHPEDGHATYGMDYDSWMRQIKQHRKDNGYPIPDNLAEIVEDQFCQLLDGEWCEFVDGSERGVHLNRRVDITTVMNGTRVMLKFIAEGMPLVSKEVAEERALTCSRCYALSNVAGCGSCAGLSDLVAQVIGAKATPHDNALEGRICLVCKCSARANAWMPVEISKVGVSEEARELFRTIPHCWKARELALTNNVGPV